METAAHTILQGAFDDLVKENIDDLGMDPPKLSRTSSALSLSKASISPVLQHEGYFKDFVQSACSLIFPDMQSGELFNDCEGPKTTVCILDASENLETVGDGFSVVNMAATANEFLRIVYGT